MTRRRGNRASAPGRPTAENGFVGMIRNLERDVGRQTGGNLYYHGARPYRNESDAVRSATDPKIGVVEEGERVHLHLVLDDAVQQAKTARVTTELLGKAEIPQVQYENSDGSPLKIETDYFGKHRSEARPTAGPFEKPGQGELKLKIW